MRRLKFIILVFRVVFFNSLFAQPSFQHYTIQEGLPSYSVLCITQDRLGFMWFGTNAGVCRYDGIRFKTYKSDGIDTAQLFSNDILSLLTDAKGSLWVGTSNGLNKYNVQTDRFERLFFHNKSINNVFCIYQDKKGRIWIGSSTGLYTINQGKLSKISVAENEEIAVRAIFEDSEGRLWMGLNSSLYQVVADKNECFLVKHALPGEALSNKNYNRITAIAEGSTGDLWIGTQNNGALVFNTNKNSFSDLKKVLNNYSLVNNNIRCIISDKNHNLWIGTQEGVSVINPVSGVSYNITHKSADKKSLSQNSVYSIYQDANSSIWIGTYFGGANLSYAYNTFFYNIQNTDEINSISNNVISSIREDDKHNFWIGTEGGGINYLNTANNHFTVYKQEPGNSKSIGSNLVKVVFIDKAGYVWSGTHGGGLNVFKPDSRTYENYILDSINSAGSEISSILEDVTGKLWVASNIGITIFSKNKTHLKPFAFRPYLANNTPRFLFKDKYNNIWVAQQSGVSYITGNTIKKISDKLIVNCFSESSSQSLWFGTNKNGLIRYDYTTNRLYTESEPFLKTLNIVGIIEQKDGSLWLSSDKGLIHFFPNKNNYQQYTLADGLAGNGFNYNSFLKSSNGYYYFGGFSGITFFSPAEFTINKTVSSIAFSGLKLNGKYLEINGTDKILSENIVLHPHLYFAYNQDIFTIEFALLNYIKSEKNKYSYKLEGFDKNWNETGQASVTYTNLPAGNYRFLVKGANNDGVWGKPIMLLIIVSPPLWLTWWAYCFYVIVAAAFIFFIIRFLFLRALLQKEDELHQAKLNFFTNASHEIRTHLTLILAPVDRLLAENKKNNFIHQQLVRVKANTTRLLNLVGELMDFRKAETNHLSLSAKKQNLIPFLQNIYESFREMSQSKNINTAFVHQEEFIEVNFDENQLEKVFFNLLANAFKFTPDGGRITLFAGIQKEHVVITVTDNGRGIKPQYLNKLFTNFFQVADHGLQNTGYGIGLALSKNIVELHQGSISVQSILSENGNEGETLFTVILPKTAVSKNSNKITIHLAEPKSESASMDSILKNPKPALDANNFSQTILIIEDNDELRQLIAEIFSNSFTILTGSNGLQGLLLAGAEIPDIIISDVMMPEMDGYTICKEIKADERTSHIPIIMLTAKSAQSEHISGLEHGADIYLTKPFSASILNLSVQNLLTGRERIRKKIAKELGHVDITSPTIKSEKKLSANTVDNEFLDKLLSLIEQYMDDPQFGVEMLCKKIAMSAPVLYKKMRALTGMSVNEFIKMQRFKKAAYLLLKKDLNISEVCYAIGYDDRKYFSREFKKYFGMLPSDFGKNTFPPDQK